MFHFGSQFARCTYLRKVLHTDSQVASLNVASYIYPIKLRVEGFLAPHYRTVRTANEGTGYTVR